ncbi:MAG: MoxR family ATPase [Bacteroidota bacterium]
MEEQRTPEFQQPIHPVFARNRVDVSKVQAMVAAIKEQLHKVVIGQDEVMELLLASLFVEGHVLMEGVPGTAKTLTARLIAQTIATDFSRIQFTPDLMPSDVVGTSVFNLKTSEFTFNPGPIFANIVLIDEINRSPAKTQAALFEVMEEQQVTIDGKTYTMFAPFFVVATQNPVEQEGTYRLPEAQLDRFLFKIIMHYPDRAQEKAILVRYQNDFRMRQQTEVEAVCTPTDIEVCRSLVEQVFIEDKLLDYIADIIQSTRSSDDLYLGASSRASLALMKAAKAIAAIDGRDFVTPDDIQRIVYPVLNHRVILTPEREMEGFSTRDVLETIIKKLEVPR